MKLIAVLALVLTSSAFANTKLACKGIDGSVGATMTLENKSSEDVPENSPIDYLLVLKEGRKIVFSSIVTGRQNDVHLSLRSRRGAPYLNTAMYMDELYDVEITVAGKNYSFDCMGE